MNNLQKAIKFLEEYEEDGGLLRARVYLGDDIQAIAPLAFGEYST